MTCSLYTRITSDKEEYHQKWGKYKRREKEAKKKKTATSNQNKA